MAKVNLSMQLYTEAAGKVDIIDCTGFILTNQSDAGVTVLIDNTYTLEAGEGLSIENDVNELFANSIKYTTSGTGSIKLALIRITKS